MLAGMSVLFCHGLESSPHGRKVQALRAAGLEVIAPDFQGQNLAARVATLLPVLREQPDALVVGSSYGGITALCAAKELAGVVVNHHPTVARREVERLEAILHNCAVQGPSTQNRDRHPRFREHLRGRVAHVAALDPRRGELLLQRYLRIVWPEDAPSGR